MSEHNQSRRTALLSLFAAGCALSLPRLAWPQAGKLSQAQAQYQGQPKGDQNCANCMQFMPPNSCKLVEGDISPNGWCKLWSRKS